MAFPPSHTFMFHTNHSHEDHHHNQHHHHHHHHNPSLNSFPPLPPQHFQTRSSAPFMVKRSMSVSGMEMNGGMMEANGGGDEELSDDGSVQIGGEKKKRLNMEQVKALEKSFEVGNKLEPERKLELAKALGLQPRQIAIWFQNRRARWKTKNLEKEYDSLKKQFDALKADNEALTLQNQKLHAQLEVLKGRDQNNSDEERILVNLVKKETEGSWNNNNNGSDENSSDINLELSRTPPLRNSPNNINVVSNNVIKPSSITQLLQFSTRSDLQDETFSNMFNTTNNTSSTTLHNHHHHQQQHNFWTWPHENHDHFH